MSQTQITQPTRPSERIMALDALRGFAILGILIMNIQSFAMPEAAYLNPAAYGNLTGLNKWVWILSHTLAEQKFMTIFAALFGAGIVLFTARLESKERRPLPWHYRRTFWLLVIGLLHAYLLWYGDVLVSYALCALVVVLCRKWSAPVLLILGLAVVAVGSLLYLFFGFSLAYMPPEAYAGMQLSWQPPPEMISHELAVYQSGWLTQMTLRIPSSLTFQTLVFLIFNMWRAGGLMLVGMALFKWGVLTAARSTRFYGLLLLVGFGLGLPPVIYGVGQNFAVNWSMDYARFFGSQFNYWGSLPVSLGYVSLVMLLCKWPNLTPLTGVLGAVGRMALTNYLLQTIICTTIFYGHGLGLFGRVERSGQILLVLGVWTFQLIISPLWLRYYHFGPAEWLWRSLTYWQLQPIRTARTSAGSNIEDAGRLQESH
ncbi:MAG: DUF418 domain-containing protein [Anaerolineae bacterium]|nr:DUF418 domain-containing protein [Anaerolineae bacterium]